MAKRSDDTERRIYVLPIELMNRVRAYQGDNSIPSEVEAVRRLLDMALQMRDTFDDIMVKLRNRYSESKDLRAIARDVLWSHPSISAVVFADDSVSFTFKDGDRGRITSAGRLRSQGVEDGYDNWSDYKTIEERAKERAQQHAYRMNLANAPRSTEKDDDEIPF